jgi:hypothetical protein
MQMLDVWTSNVEGFGRLPDAEELALQLQEAGLVEVTTTRAIPGEQYFAFSATRPASSPA